MKKYFLTAAALSVLALNGQASAQDFTINSGFALTSTYIDKGRPVGSPRASFQGYSEVETRGFYLRTEFATVRLGPDRLEATIGAGFRNSVGALSYELGFERTFYNRSGNCCGEIRLGLGLDAAYGMRFGGEVAYDTTEELYTTSVSAGYGFNDMFDVSAEFGRLESSHNFWNLGVSYMPMANTSLDLRYHDSNGDKGRLVGTVSYDFSLR